MYKLYFISLLFACNTLFSQAKVDTSKLTKVSLPELNMEYEVPSNWVTTPFFKVDWETPGGNNLCACAGVLNAWKVPGGSDFEYIYMAAYPSDRKHVNAEKRQSVWQYRFVHVEKVDTVKTDFLVWEKQVSKLKPSGSSDNRFKDYVAYRFESHFGATYFLMYIWGKPYMLQQQKAKLDAIIASFKAIK
ncbi:MAG: hypothetical protein K0S33_4201 [Bacteroidetes bacterium]|jgi:hypothetical protein|nr:hypothetical protein [Bacteroidota bacterium]